MDWLSGTGLVKMTEFRRHLNAKIGVKKMARCDIAGCDWYGKASGKAIHMARVHGVHPTHEETADDTWTLNVTLRTVGEGEPLSSVVEVPLPVKGVRLIEPIVQRWDD